MTAQWGVIDAASITEARALIGTPLRRDRMQWVAEATRDAVRVTIRDFLWSDKTGLPVTLYSEDDVNIRAVEVFRHVFRAYPTVPSPYYESAAA